MNRIYFCFFFLIFIACNDDNNKTENNNDSIDRINKDSVKVVTESREKIELLPDSISNILFSLGLCLIDTLEEDSIGDSYYYYCDSNYFHIYKIHSNLSWKQALLIEIKKNTGTGGFHYFVFKKEGDKYKQLNFFQGWLDSLKKNEKGYYDIVFRVGGNTPWERIKLLLTMQGKNYKFEKVLQVTETNTDKDSIMVVKKYSKKYDSPEFWKFMSY